MEKLKERIEEEGNRKGTQTILVFPEELQILNESNNFPRDIVLEEDLPSDRFLDSYMERVDKETENLIEVENPNKLLHEPVAILKKKKNEFLYIESKWFDVVKIDGLSMEYDIVFSRYFALFGLRVPKKAKDKLKSFFSESLHGDETSYRLMFNDQDGVWDVNFSFERLDGFHDEITVGEAIGMIYRFLLQLHLFLKK
ncbi:hypothetical protein RZN22_08495 [Bacillaceae bacterium S4-13-58]